MSAGKVLLIVGLVFVGGLMLLAGSCAGLLFYGYSSSDAVAGPRVDDLFRAVQAGDEVEFLSSQTTGAFRAAASPEAMTRLADTFRSELGPLKSRSMRSFNARTSNGQSTIEATYQAQFDKGPGEVVLTLRKTGSGSDAVWKFDALRVNSPLLDRAANRGAVAEDGPTEEGPAEEGPAEGAEVTAEQPSPVG
ncbi:MAG: hypothetical protein AAF790_09570 [Planctomycetota bacterium]